MKNRLLSLLLCFVMVLSLFPAIGMSAVAAGADANGITNPDPVTGDLNLTKKLTAGENGSYDISMEAWSTGKVEYTTYTEKIPTDFVVIVDQSGSMALRDMSAGDNYSPAGSVTLDNAASGEYYYFDEETQQYYRVYGQRGYMYQRYDANTNYANAYIDDEVFTWIQFGDDNANEVDPLNLFYIKVDGVYRKVYTRVAGASSIFGSTKYYNCQFWYLDDNGNRQEIGTYRYASVIGINISQYVNAVLYKVRLGNSALYYRDVNGNVKIVDSTTSGIGTAEFCNNSAQALSAEKGSVVTYNNLYTYDGVKEERLTSLEKALNAFVEEVAKERDSNGLVDNRIAIVGFSSPNASGYHYNNNEVLTGTDISVGDTDGLGRSGSSNFFPYYGPDYAESTSRNASNYNGAQYGTAQANSAYPNALLNAAVEGTFGTVNPDLTKAIKSITAYGGTKPEYGFNMAQSIFAARQNTTYTMRTGDEAGTTVPRNKIVIFFTDGEPGNNDTANRYEEANTVVEKAKVLKDGGATVFTIGVFGESDSQPLTYVYTPGNQEIPENNFSFVRKSGSNYLFRQWNHSDPAKYGEIPSDTIFDYMSVVSSNYQSATDFINPRWLNRTMPPDSTYLDAIAVRGEGYKVDGALVNKYYRMASNQQSLIEAFKEAVTLTTEESHSSATVKIDNTAVFRDKVNLADFDVSEATYTVQWQPVRMQGDELVNNGSAVPKGSGEVAASGVVEATDFNYSSEDFYVTADSPGYKLVVTISGLTPKKAGGTLYSNLDVKDDSGNDLFGAGIYGAESDTPAIQIASPSLELPSSAKRSFVIDFNAKMDLVPNAKLGYVNEDNQNGTFSQNGTGVAYQFDMDRIDSGNASLVMDGVDSAMAFLNAAREWNQLIAIPASNIYIDDDLLDATLDAGDGIGRNEDIANTVSNAETAVDANGKAEIWFSFTGTGADVYCTTYSEGGYVSAGIFKNDELIKDRTVSMRNYSEKTHYNVPTISFTGLEYGTYKVKLTARAGCNYKLDGVRIYGAMANNEAVYTENGAAANANAAYYNLRKMLLNDGQVADFGTESAMAAKKGVLYLDSVSTTTDGNNMHEVPWNYDSARAVYEKDGPKNEIYLSKDQGIVFSVDDYANLKKNNPDMEIYVGLSVADESTSVSITDGETVSTPTISSVVDQYYKLVPAADGSCAIANTGSGILAVTDIQITGMKTRPVVDNEVNGVLPDPDNQEAVTLTLVVNNKTLDYAAKFMSQQESTAVDQAQVISSMIKDLLSNFVAQLFNSISRLFGN